MLSCCHADYNHPALPDKICSALQRTPLHHWRCYHSVTLIRKLSQSLNSYHRVRKNQGNWLSFWLLTIGARTNLSDTNIPPPFPSLALPLEDQTWGMCTCWYLKYTGINYNSQRKMLRLLTKFWLRSILWIVKNTLHCWFSQLKVPVGQRRLLFAAQSGVGKVTVEILEI